MHRKAKRLQIPKQLLQRMRCLRKIATPHHHNPVWGMNSVLVDHGQEQLGSDPN
jgi:hypothetical protein